MSVSRPARCLLSKTLMPTVRPRTQCQNFHSSPNLCVRTRPSGSRFRIQNAVPEAPAHEVFKHYDEKEKIQLKRKYTPEQIEAIEAGERAIDPADLAEQGVIRTDLGALPYLDDLSQNAKFIDKNIQSNRPPARGERMMTQEEWGRHMAAHLMDTGSHVKATERRNRAFEDYWIRDQKPCFQCGDKGHDEVVCNNKPLPEPERQALEEDWETSGRFDAMRNFDTEQPAYKTMKEKLDEENNADLLRAFQGFTGWIGSNGPIIDDPSTSVGSATALAPPIPRRLDPSAAAKLEAAKKEGDSRDEEGIYDRIREQLGMTLSEILNLKTKSLVMNYVTNQTRLGKVQSIYILTIAGNGNGKLGIGEAKGQEIEETRFNSRMDAIRKMRPIPRYEERTIFGEVEGKSAAATVKLMARPPGFGLRCQHLIFHMCRAAGIYDIAARVPRSRNKMNTVKAAYKALMSQRSPDEIARGRGKKLVDVRKVYYGGRV